MKQDKMSNFKALLIIGAVIAFFIYLDPWQRNPYEDLDLPSSLGYEEVSEAIPVTAAYCLTYDKNKPNGHNLIRCEITEGPSVIKIGSSFQTSEGLIKVKYLVADDQGMSALSTKGTWSCIGMETLDPIKIEQDKSTSTWIAIPDCVPRVCDAPILTQTPERGLLQHCINLVTGLSEVENKKY